MKRIILDSNFNSEVSEETLKKILSDKSLILMGITTDSDGTSAEELLKTTSKFIPLRRGRKENDKFYQNEASKFISGTARENPLISIVTDGTTTNFEDAVMLDEFLHENIEYLIVLNAKNKENIIPADKEYLKKFIIINEDSFNPEKMV